MSFLSSLLAWANAPFTIALSVAVLFAFVQMTGLLGLVAGGGDGDHDTDGGHDIDHEADGGHDADASADHDADGDHDADTDHDHDADHEQAGPSFGHQLLAGIGVGRVPLSIVWQSYAVAFALAGLVANAFYLSHRGELPPYTLLWTLPGALVAGYVATRLTSGMLGRVLADPKQEATTRKQLVGHTGVVISSKVNDEFGEVRVRDKTGHVVRIVCHTRVSEAPIVEGREVVIVDYDAAAGRLYVAPLDPTEEEEEAVPPSATRARTGK